MTRSQATPASSQMIWMEQRIAELEKQLAANKNMTERMVKMSAKDIDAMMAEIKAQAKEIAELRELNLAQIKTIRTLQTKVSYYKEISEDMERELDGNSN